MNELQGDFRYTRNASGSVMWWDLYKLVFLKFNADVTVGKNFKNGLIVDEVMNVWKSEANYSCKPEHSVTQY